MSTRLVRDDDGRPLYAEVTMPAVAQETGQRFTVLGSGVSFVDGSFVFTGVDVGRRPTWEEQVVPRAPIERLEQRSYSDDVRSRAKELWTAGMSWQAIASAVGAPKSTVGMWLKPR